MNDSDEIFISFGEIDCRKYEGILNFSIKKNKDFSKVCQETIMRFLDYMKISLRISQKDIILGFQLHT